MEEEPFHPGLAFKQISTHQSIYSVRIGLSYRALGIKEGNSVVWFWIGSHEDYNTLIKQFLNYAEDPELHQW
ncbi:ParE family toxin-like protein [Chryseosolibacter histidini]|uniref:ParE family toxin-like protein n=1 Tax=Chryseosolibacter histidini TaxID=2782349 RepID=UPI003F693A47